MNSGIIQSIVNKLHINSDDASEHTRRHDDLDQDTIIIKKSNITALLNEMLTLAVLHKNIYNDYTKESNFLKFTIRHEFNQLSDELFILLGIVYKEFKQHLNIFKKVLRYNEIDFVITCNKQMLSFMDDETTEQIIMLNVELMKTPEHAEIDNNFKSIKEIINTSSLTLATSALLCMKNYPRNLYSDISYDRFLVCDNLSIVLLAKKIKDHSNNCTNIEIMAYLHDIPLFSSINYEELYHLALRVKTQSYPINTDIINQGDIASSLYIITSGEVEILVNDKQVNILENGDYFGEIAIIADVRRTATVRTSSDCTMLKLDTRDFKELVYENPKISMELMKEITNRLLCNSRIS